MPALSVIIPSRKIENLALSVSAVQRRDPGLRILVVDDGLEWQKMPELKGRVEIIAGAKPFVYARNCNLGIRAAELDDVVLLNDDALLMVPGGLRTMQRQHYADRKYGLIASSIDHCGTPEQFRKAKSGLRELPIMAMFACVFIPRSTIEKVGMLDERFAVNAGGDGIPGYGCEDDDYSWRVREAGLKLGVSDSCHVDHSTLQSTFRVRDQLPKQDRRVAVVLHEQVFKDKWGKDAHR